MELNEIEILEKYFNYRKNNNVKDEVVDNIFFKEIFWTNSKNEIVYLYKTYEDINRFFQKDIRKKCIENVPYKTTTEEKKVYCGTMLHNASICDDINEVIYNRIYEELKKRNFGINVKGINNNGTE